MSQISNTSNQTFPCNVPGHGSEPHRHLYHVRQYPTIWQGHLVLKDAQALVQLHFVCGNMDIAKAVFPHVKDGEPVKIAQIMQLDQEILDGVFSKMQIKNEHCILMAFPCGKDLNELVEQANNLKFHFVNYFMNKGAAGSISANAPGTQCPAFVVHIFPSCDYTRHNVFSIAPHLVHLLNEVSHLVIIIETA